MNKGRIARGVLAALLVAGLLTGVQSSAVAVGTSYRDAVLADNPVAYWRLGEAAGTVAADAVGSLDGTYEGSPVLAVAGLTIDSDTAVRFGGGPDLVHVPDSPLINLGNHTRRSIEAWFRVDDAGPRQVIVDEGGTTRGLNIYVEGGQVYVGGWNTNDDFSPDTPWGGTFLAAPVTTGAAHHVVLVLDQPSGTLTGYLDGESIGSGAGGTLHGHGSDTGIGGMNIASRFHDGPRGGDGYHFVGVIDEVAFYNSVLTAGDVAAHYAAGLAPAEDPSVAFLAPTDGAVVAGTIPIEAAATDPQDTPDSLSVDISTDGGATFAPAAFNPGSETHSISWDTTATPDGPATLVARVQDTSGNTATSAIAVSISNDPGTDDYADVVLGDGPVVYYRLGEVGGTTATDEIGNVDAGYVGGPSLGEPGLVAGADTAVAFDGTNDLVDVPDSDLINKGQFPLRSVEAWFSVADTGPRQVVYEEGAGTRGLSIYVEAGRLYAGAWNLAGQTWGPLFLDTLISAGETHHVVAVLGSGSFELFLDGVSAGAVAGAGTLYNHNSDTGIGAMNDSARFHDDKVAGNGFYFEGTIDEVAVYNSMLGSAAVAAHFAAGQSGGAQDPAVTFFSPAEAATLDGVVLVELTASDPQDPAAGLTVEVAADGTTFTPATFSAATGRFEWTWDTSGEPDGLAILTGRVTDSDGNAATDTRNFIVDNATANDPSVSFFVPGQGETVGGLVTIEVTAADPQDAPSDLVVDVSTDGGATFSAAAYNAGTGRHELVWDTTADPDGPATLLATVEDTDANTASDSISLSVDNAAASEPSVAFLVPTGGATVDGTVIIEVAAADPQDPPAALAVDISTDGGSTFAPATYNAATERHELVWDTTAGPDGWVGLAATVTDTDSNSASDSIDVFVDNASANTPSVSFFSPADSDTVNGLVMVEVTASDPQTTADQLTVEFSIDGGATFAPAIYQPATQRHTLDWDTELGADGPVTLVAMVSDPDAYMAMDSIVVTVDNASVNAPSVVFVDPTDGAEVSGTITIEVAASDPQSAADVLTVDVSTDGGVTFAPAAFTPGPDTHSLSWDTTTAPDGAAVLVARAVDPDGYMSSEQISVTVGNASPTAYRDAVLASAPSVYWRLGEASGTTAFDLVGGLDSTYVGGPQLGAAGLVADADTAVSFDGVDDLVAVPDSSLINLGTRTRRTISVWFNADDVTARRVIVDEGGVTRGLSMYVYQSNLYIGAWNPQDDPSADTPWGPVFFSAPVAPGQTYNAVAVLDQPTASFTAYVNGVAIGSASAGTLHGHGSDTGIGAMNNATRFHDTTSTGNGYHFDGVIDEVAFYNATLDSATVANLYLIGQALAEDPSAAFFNPQNGNVVSGSITIEVAASDPQDAEGLLDVDISTDGGATFSQAAFNAGTLRHTLPWDTTAAPDGTSTLVARVTDTDLNQTTSAINVTVANTGATHMIIAAGDISHCNNTNDTDTANLITQIIAGTSLPVTVVPVGDLAYEDGSADDFANCYDPTWGQHKAITKPVPGNHEYNTPGATGYYDYFGSVAAPPDGWYRYELAGWEIYALNSNCGSIGTCDATTPQVQWLRSELAASSNACSLAFFHHPRFTEQNPFGNLEEFWKAMYDFGGDLIVSAHAHYYAHSALQDWQGNADPVNGIRQIIAGTGGRSLHGFPGNPHPNQQVVDNTTYGVVVIELSAGGYDWQFRRVGDGAILYSGSDVCH